MLIYCSQKSELRGEGAATERHGQTSLLEAAAALEHRPTSVSRGFQGSFSHEEPGKSHFMEQGITDPQTFSSAVTPHPGCAVCS